MKIELIKPITAHGEETKELTFREPGVKDVREVGIPQLLLPGSDTVAIEVRADVVAKYISRLTGIPMSSVDQLSIKDFQICMGVVMGFFNNGGE